MKICKKILSILMVISIIITIGAVSFSAAGASLNTKEKVSFTLNCDKPHYEFTVYRVATMSDKYSQNAYQVRYTPIINAVNEGVANGDSAALLEVLDGLSESALLSPPTNSVGTYKVDTDGETKTFSNLAAGVYYVRATNFPAGVKSVTNSVFALPYYTAEDGWVNTIDPVPLASKIDDGEAKIKKIITNSTKNNENYTDVSLGDTVTFNIQTDPAGSLDFKLGSYVISDKMSKGLTLNQNSITVKLLDESNIALSTLALTTDYTVSTTAADGEDTAFTISLTPAFLAKNDFYAENVKKVSYSYSAVLNKHAVIGKAGNPNEAEYLEFSNKNGVTSKVDGNKVYVYTYAVQINKYNESGAPLSGADFALYTTESDAKDEKNAIATGTSNAEGIVKFYNSSEEEMKLQSGRYYIKETKAPANYNRITDVIGIGDNPVKIDVTYGDTLVNGTYVTSAPENGVVSVGVKNTKTLLPQTGGQGEAALYVFATFLTLIGVTVFAVSRKKNAVTK